MKYPFDPARYPALAEWLSPGDGDYVDLLLAKYPRIDLNSEAHGQHPAAKQPIRQWIQRMALEELNEYVDSERERMFDLLRKRGALK